MPGDRSEQATPQRREKARKEGDCCTAASSARRPECWPGSCCWARRAALSGRLGRQLGGFLSYGEIAAWEPQRWMRRCAR
jgi:hypothetical protein